MSIQARLLLLPLLAFCLSCERTPKPTAAAPRPVVDQLSSLKGVRSERPLAKAREARAIVLVFMGSRCRLTRQYFPTLVQLEEAYRSKGVLFAAVYSNTYDTEADIAAQLKAYGAPFDAIRDAEGTLAGTLGATATPEAVVVAPNSETVYRGRIDDQFGLGFERPAANSRELIGALDAVLRGDLAQRPSVKAPGCAILRKRPTQTGEVTFYKDVQKILQEKCQLCHRPGQIGGFSLVDYQDAHEWSDTIADRVRDRLMPPFNIDPASRKVANDLRLTDDEYKTVLRWVELGAPPGDPADGPSPKVFPGGWNVGPPDLVVTVPKPFHVPASGIIEYEYVLTDYVFQKDTWVNAAQVMPRDPKVVHHATAFAIYPEEMKKGIPHLDALPGRALASTGSGGENTSKYPPGYAKLIPKGSRIYFEIHYVPQGAPTEDQMSVGLVFERAPKVQVMSVPIVDLYFSIPPNAPNHEVTASYEVPMDGKIIAAGPHMHVRGKDFKYELKYPDGRTELLLNVPRWDFHSPVNYKFAELVPVTRGTTVRCIAHFDNSKANPSNPDPTKTVSWGQQSFDEMMVGWIDIAFDLPIGSPRMRELNVAMKDFFPEFNEDG